MQSNGNNVHDASSMMWEIGDLPFHIGTRPVPTNAPFPDMLPMSVALDPDTGALVQVMNDVVRTELERAYAAGSQIGTPLSDSGSGQPALDDFFSFIRDLAGQDLEGRSVLEIGCGSGALLRRLASAGADVLGIEPGRDAARRARQFGLEVLPEPFDPHLLSGQRFDIVLHHTVLEHVEHPVDFLADQLGLLAPGGWIACAVPDDSHSLTHGDLSLLVHEHVTYFNPDLVERVAARAGAAVRARRQSRTVGATYFGLQSSPPEASFQLEASESPVAGFFAEARRGLVSLRAFSQRIGAGGGTLGIYCPTRFINYHALLDSVLPPIRYFDDDPLLHGTYVPPFDVCIEPREQLIERPVSELLIVSWTFADTIAASLRERRELEGTVIHTLREVLVPDS